MNTIRELFWKKIDRKIEEVIKVDQADEETVLDELEEYIATDAIKEHFCTVYQAVAEAPAEPHEGIGVWVSGFFGSGKSSFAKILGYTIAARPVCGKTASQLFKENVKDRRISDLLDFINTRIPTHAVIFDVSMDRGVRTASERITEVMYKALLRELDYAEDFDLAELEMSLEADGLLDRFRERFQELHNSPWEKRRKVGLGVNEASAVLHHLDPNTYPHADSWARSLGQGRADVTPNLLAERAFELVARRRPGQALMFVVDEVGQFIARGVDKMLDLQAVVQAFGVTGKNRVKAKKATAPCWVVVTSQEKLDEVVGALDSKKVELARLQDRFPITVDLKQSDIAEVTGKRVLDKSEPGIAVLEDLYAKNEGRLKTFCSLERTSRDVSIKQPDFVNLYPYLPYQIDLCIDIVAGLRLRRGAHRDIGGSNRTIIKQAQQMLVHPQTNLADATIGTLVTLDRVYELLYAGNLLPSEVTREVEAVAKQLPGKAMAVKAAKAIALLEAVKDLPRTAHNVAVVLHPDVRADSILEEVKAALKSLEVGQIVRESDEGYKLLTVQEKSWDTTRRGLDPKPRDRNDIQRELLGEIFAEPRLKSYRYKNLRPFRVSLLVDGEAVDAEGQVAFNILPADDMGEWSDRCREARTTSNERKNELFWVTGLSEEIHRQIEELYRSREMVSLHERLASQGRLTPEEASCLAEEKVRRDRIQRDLRGRLAEALQAGTGFFRGVQKDGSALGDTLPGVMQGLLDSAIPELYPKLEMGTRPLKGDEPEKLLTAANLDGLPPIFYDGENGLGLVVRQGGRFVPDPDAPICKEVLDYLKREHSYGNKVTGKSLEAHFQGIGYGWERDVLRLVLAVLLRGGAIEVIYQGRRHRNHNDPACREPFTNNNAFRSASFAPREALDFKMLADAARYYEEITGREVDIEESAIAQAFQRLAAEDREELLPLVARMNALGIPGVEGMAEYLQSVEGILGMPADDCVKTLADTGTTYKETRGRMARLVEATSSNNTDLLRRAHQFLDLQWPVLEARCAGEEAAAKAAELRKWVGSARFYEQMEAIRLATGDLTGRYTALYATVHAERAESHAAALDAIKGLPEWAMVCEDPSITEAQRGAVIARLLAPAQEKLDLPDGADVCRNCRATVGQMESDVAAVEALKSQAIQRLQELVAPDRKIERVRVSSFLGGVIERAEDVEAGIGRLREHLLKLLAEGVRVVLE